MQKRLAAVTFALAIGLGACTKPNDCTEPSPSQNSSHSDASSPTKAARSVTDLVSNTCKYVQANDDYDYVDLTFAIPLREENIHSGITERVELFQLTCGLDPPGTPNPQRWKCDGARIELTHYLKGDTLNGPVPLTDYSGVNFRLVKRSANVFTVKSERHPFAGRADLDAVEIKVDLGKGEITYLAESTRGTEVFKTVKGAARCESSNWPPGVPYWKRK